MTPSVPTLLPDSRCLELVTKGALVGRQQRKIRVGVKNALGVSEWGAGWSALFWLPTMVFYVSASVWRLIERDASRQGMTVSAWTCQALTREVTQTLKAS